MTPVRITDPFLSLPLISSIPHDTESPRSVICHMADPGQAVADTAPPHHRAAVIGILLNLGAHLG